MVSTSLSSKRRPQWRSGIGKPLYPDAITRACTRLDFARVCVMLDISSKLSKHIVIMVLSEDGKTASTDASGTDPTGTEGDFGCLGDQFVHCDVYIRYLHIHVFITIAYGVNDVVGQRLWWAELGRISHTVCDVLWLVGGNFNTVLDDSEVCGKSWDIRGAAEEFQGCLRDTTLITLLMQGGWFSWHNCSRDSRSLWKLLDRLLVNDCWPGAWPNTFYVSLNAQTSDYSPLVLRGDDAGHNVSMFRFDNYLTLSSKFLPSVQRVWKHHIVGTTMFAITRKLKALKPIFRAQRQKKGDMSTNVKPATTFLDSAQALLA
ncbi:UNVERIFIED_CONTAM: hypothetical protein Sradi_3837300 [Sesamum radiatum]|uniref:Uncharacterized protein n=1 Tax=Sesamum radiatum TaxID=300843 RepID=A0AAW2Q193_SESRA